jgi:hypothetical protein
VLYWKNLVDIDAVLVNFEFSTKALPSTPLRANLRLINSRLGGLGNQPIQVDDTAERAQLAGAQQL